METSVTGPLVRLARVPQAKHMWEFSLLESLSAIIIIIIIIILTIMIVTIILIIVPSGAKKLIAKIKEFNPKIAVFNGKGIYEVFSGQKEFIFGKQPEKIRDTETVGRFYFCYFCLA